MLRRIVFAVLLALQLAVVTSVASGIAPAPTCGPCPKPR